MKRSITTYRWYDVFMSPLEKLWIKRLRSLLISKAEGIVVEVGFGTGANYPYYDFSKVNHIIATDVIKRRLHMYKVKYRVASAISLPFDDSSIDTVVATLVLCSVDDTEKAINEIYRVLKPNGKYIFIEHVRPDNNFSEAFDIVNKAVWHKVSNSCQINKKTIELIKKKNWLVKHNMTGGILGYGIAIKK